MSRVAGFCQGSSHQLQVIARNSFPTSGTAAATRPSDVRLTSPRFERRHVIDDGAGRVRTRIEFVVRALKKVEPPTRPSLKILTYDFSGSIEVSSAKIRVFMTDPEHPVQN